MLSNHIIGEFGITVLKHLGYPAIANAAIADNAEVVDHPVDGLARAGLSEVIAGCCMAKLGFGEHGRHFKRPVEAAQLNHTELRGLRDTELLAEVLEGIGKCFVDSHLSHIFWGRTQKPQPPYISDLLIGGLQYRGRLQKGQSAGTGSCGVNPGACPPDCPDLAFSS